MLWRHTQIRQILHENLHRTKLILSKFWLLNNWLELHRPNSRLLFNILTSMSIIDERPLFEWTTMSNIVRYCFLGEWPYLSLKLWAFKYTWRVKVQLKKSTTLLRKWFYVKFSARVRPCESLNIVNKEKNIKFTVVTTGARVRSISGRRTFFAQNSIGL